MNATHYDPNKLKALREQKEMSQQDVASALSVHRQTVYRAEAGIDVSYELLCALANFYDADVIALLYPRPLAIAA